MSTTYIGIGSKQKKINMKKLALSSFLQLSSRSKLRDLFVNQNNQIITFVAAAFAVFLICVTAVYYIRTGSYEAFRFGGGDTLIEGATNGCEPKDIIALADDLSQEPLISQMAPKEGSGLNVSLKKYPELQKSMEQFMMFTMLTKFSATTRSKPDEQIIRQRFADMATKKETDCKMNNLLKHINSGPYSADDAKVIKKYANRFEEIGKCLGVCKPDNT
jgi:hypothetical protein